MANLKFKHAILAFALLFLVSFAAAHGETHGAEEVGGHDGEDHGAAIAAPAGTVPVPTAVANTVAVAGAVATPSTVPVVNTNPTAASADAGHGADHGDGHEATTGATTTGALNGATVASSAQGATGHGHGGSNVMMTPFFHMHTGDALFFEQWIPRSIGAMLGSCIGLFLLAIFERGVNALRARLEIYWRLRASVAYNDRISSDKEQLNGGWNNFKVLSMRNAPPFLWKNDIPRGIMHAGHAFLGFIFMLAVMTYQVFFILAIVLGLGIGEIIFGRFAGGSQTNGH